MVVVVVALEDYSQAVADLQVRAAFLVAAVAGTTAVVRAALAAAAV